ncbi:MAG: hypothetical protein IKT00_07595 [Prevotella sp.]|nr:hypothetical protein [Paludibacteraceae bacterium]MBR4389026.1 hypothetical protein [Prevotella sp.]
MNKWLFFIGGILTGIVLAVVFSLLINSKEQPKPEGNTPTPSEKKTTQTPEGVTFFDGPGVIMDAKSYKVIQVVFDNGALVREPGEYGLYVGKVSLLVDGMEKYFYDDEIVNVPEDKVVRQVGIYRYRTKDKTVKTVPIIKIMDK